MSMLDLIYLIMLSSLGILNLWLVKQNYHRSFTLGVSPLNSPLFDQYSFLLNSFNYLLWTLSLFLGIYWDVLWWLSPIIFYISYSDGKKRSINKEYQLLKEKELQVGLKDINGNPSTAEEEIKRLLEFRKKKLSGFFNA